MTQLRRILTIVFQIFVGVLFIFSGFIKANDPKGFAYKLDEYFSVFTQAWPGGKGLFSFFGSISHELAMLICAFEIFVGILLLIGIWRRFTVSVLLLMIVFFTFLTFYSAYYDKVTDCGCFGDAIKLTPWGSFTKDIILLIPSIYLFIHWRWLKPALPGKAKLASGIAIGGGIFSLLFTIYCHYYLPVIDFRPYKIGNDIEALMHSPADTLAKIPTRFYVYKNEKDTNQIKRFRIDSMNKVDLTGYKYSSYYETEKPKPKQLPPVHDFTVDSKDSSLTWSFLHQKGYRLFLAYYLLDKANTGAQPALNELTSSLLKEGKVRIWGVTSASEQERNDFIKKYNLPYPLYTMDGTTLKTMIRSNPGLILFKDNVVKMMWPSTSLPSKEQLMKYIQ